MKGYRVEIIVPARTDGMGAGTKLTFIFEQGVLICRSVGNYQKCSVGRTIGEDDEEYVLKRTPRPLSRSEWVPLIQGRERERDVSVSELGRIQGCVREAFE